jgi:6-phosphogluconolactonase
MQSSQAHVLRGFVFVVAVVLFAGLAVNVVAAQDAPGAVYVLTNQSGGNAVQVYARSADGTLSFSDSFSTGGQGIGSGPDPLGSQGALVLGGRQRLLLAVNAGSNDISVFAVDGLSLRLIDKKPSGGQMPVSIAVHDGLVYVLNAAGTPNVQGFLIEPSSGHLIHLPGSQRNLAGSAGSSPAQVGFSTDGDVLMVTEKATNKIDVWTVNDDGYAENARTITSSGATPFGFTFVHQFAVVSEATPSALSSYEVDDEDAELELRTATLSDTQKANCWVIATRNGRYAYTTNTGSGTISSYLISKDGFLNLLNVTAGRTAAGGAPIDMALSKNSRFLYVRDGVKGMVDEFRVESDGSLTPLGQTGGVPAGAQGLAAR